MEQTRFLGVILDECITWIIVARNSIVRKLARGYCLCYCKTFSLVPDSTECTKFLFYGRVQYIICKLKSYNIIVQRKITNTEQHFHL